jgi:hypothetical protein
VGLSGHIPIATTDPKRERVATALLHAAHHAAKACAAESDGRLQDAYDQWSIVFNGNFPKR